MHIHIYRKGPTYDNNSTLSRLEWKRDLVCRCGNIKKTIKYTWGDQGPGGIWGY